MSLLIDALKKQRLTSSPSLAEAGGDALKSVSSDRTKKIMLISLVAIIVISLTATTSFLVFKHVEDKRVARLLLRKTAQAQTVKALLAEKSGQAVSGAVASAAPGEMREKLQQRMQQKNQAPVAVASSAEPTNASNPIPAAAPPIANIPTAATPSNPPLASAPVSAPIASSGGSLHDRLAAHQAGGSIAASTQQDNTSQNSSASSIDTNTETGTDTSSVDTASDDSRHHLSDADSSANSKGDKVNIQVVSDSQGVNNPTYQKALGFMQINQYDKALALLVDNDDLLMKTQGLSALLLARIYLTTGQYELADQVLDRAMLLHAGSDMDMLGLRAQALFMQKKYQETIDLLASQSPDLTVSPGYYALLADAYMHLNQAGNAVSVFQQIVERFPNSPDYWLGLAVAYQKTGDAGSAMVAYRRAAQLSLNDPQVTLFINQQLQALQAV